jgi:hypothetical protein
MLVSSGIMAQDCELYLPLVENTGVQYQNFNRRDKLEGTQDIMIKKISSTANETEALISAKYYDNRERFQHEGEYTIICKGNELIIDMQSMMDPNMMEGYKDMEVIMKSNNLSLPSKLNVGDQLPDANMDMQVSSSGMTISDIKLIIRNRKVEGIENITTPAGTYECFKISYENFMETRTMGIPIKMTTKAVEYYAPGVGNVRSEYYDSKDRLQSYTVLSKIY